MALSARDLAKKAFWGLAPLLPDATRLRILFRRAHGTWPDLDRPVSFSEKIQWRKLHDRRDVLTLFADKFRVREYVGQKLGKEVLTEVYWSSEDPTTLDLAHLPPRFVLKANHGTRWNILVPDKDTLDRAEAVATLRRWLADRYPPLHCEWGYENVRPIAFAEEFLSLSDGSIPPDFKFFVFGGRVRMIQVDLDRSVQHTRCLYDPDWRLLPVVLGYPPGAGIARPPNLDAMMRCAQTLADGIDFVRVDLYNVDGRIVFGELTNYPGGGLEPIKPTSFDRDLGAHWALPTLSA